MNNLSWLLYWADTLPSMATGVAIISSIAFLVSLIATVYYLIVRSEVKDAAWDTETGDYKRVPTSDAIQAQSFWWSPWVSLVLITVALLTNLVPSKQTIYLIAGSEMGEQVLNTPEIVKIRGIINGYLDKELKPKTNEDKE